MNQTVKYDAYTAGRECYERNGRIGDCPFAYGTTRYNIWVDGFTDAVAATAKPLGGTEGDYGDWDDIDNVPQ